MHKNEFPIDILLVKALIENQCPKWADLPIQPVSSSGTDNALFRLGNEYVIRLPRIDWTPGSVKALVEKESTWLPLLSSMLTTPISVPIFTGQPTSFYPWPWSIAKWQEGYHPSFEISHEHAQLAQDLAAFLNELHTIKLEGGPPSRRGVALKTVDIETRQAISELEGEVDRSATIALWEKLSQLPIWHKTPVWLHGDLLPGNVLVQNNRLNAVIDFSDVGMGDPACDLIIAWCLFQPTSRNIFKSSLENLDENTWLRGKGWALSIALVLLPYYKHSNPVLAALARRMLDNIFHDETTSI